MHYIQKHILDELRTHDSLRYAALNPGDIESGHFRYHLTQLVKDGYVEQVERGLYKLTTAGEHAVDKLSDNRTTTVDTPKVITYTLLRNSNAVYLQKKSKQPYMGLLNMIGGKLHEGETAAQAAVREVQKKTGLVISEPELAGVFEIIIRKDAGVLTHAVAYVFVVDVQNIDVEKCRLKHISVNELSGMDGLAPDFLPVRDSLRDGVVQTQVFTIEL